MNIGIIHFFLNLHNARSYRSTSSSPNSQNIPVRDEEMMNVVRSGIFPHPDQQLVEIDIQAAEVSIAACYSKDEELIRYCQDDKSDMHRDQAMRLYKLRKNQVTKNLRYYAKNCFVFPQFYGSWWDPCSKDLWENAKDDKLPDGTPFLAHIKSKGIENFTQFARHVQKEETEFWKKFSGYARWKEGWVQKYYETGKVPQFHGFRRQGFLSRNKILNSSIQGTAFHCLLWSFIRLNDISKREKWKSKLIAQIHDCILWSAEPEELDMVLEVTERVMCQDIKEPHDWLIVPLRIEVELCGINEPWSRKKTQKK